MDETEKARRLARVAQLKAAKLAEQQPAAQQPAKPQQAEQGQQEGHQKAAKRSKKGDMAKLPADWRQRVLDEAVRGGARAKRIADAVAVLWATGCRPAELQKGVRVQLVGKQLVVTIEGAKVGTIDNGEVKAERGIAKRRLTLDADLNDATRRLAALAAGGGATVAYNAGTLRVVMNKLSLKVLGASKAKNPPTISAYSFRHGMASDLKSCDSLTDEERAQVLGHLAVDSIQSYGRRRRGGGAVSPVKSVATSRQTIGGVSHGYKKSNSANMSLKV